MIFQQTFEKNENFTRFSDEPQKLVIFNVFSQIRRWHPNIYSRSRNLGSFQFRHLKNNFFLENIYCTTLLKQYWDTVLKSIHMNVFSSPLYIWKDTQKLKGFQVFEYLDNFCHIYFFHQNDKKKWIMLCWIQLIFKSIKRSINLKIVIVLKINLKMKIKFD